MSLFIIEDKEKIDEDWGTYYVRLGKTILGTSLKWLLTNVHMGSHGYSLWLHVHNPSKNPSQNQGILQNLGAPEKCRNLPKSGNILGSEAVLLCQLVRMFGAEAVRFVY